MCYGQLGEENIISYKPLPSSITIKKSDIHGFGLFSTEFIPKNTNLGIAHIKIPHSEEIFPQSYCRTPLGGFYNHSKKPNCHLEARLIYFCASTDHRRLVTTVLELYTLKDIPKDTEITTKYTLYEMDS